MGEIHISSAYKPSTDALMSAVMVKAIGEQRIGKIVKKRRIQYFMRQPTDQRKLN